MGNRPSWAVTIGENGLETNFGVTFKLDVIPLLSSCKLYCPKKSQGFRLERRVFGGKSSPDLNDNTIIVPGNNSNCRAGIWNSCISIEFDKAQRRGSPLGRGQLSCGRFSMWENQSAFTKPVVDVLYGWVKINGARKIKLWVSGSPNFFKCYSHV